MAHVAGSRLKLLSTFALICGHGSATEWLAAMVIGVVTSASLRREEICHRDSCWMNHRFRRRFFFPNLSPVTKLHTRKDHPGRHVNNFQEARKLLATERASLPISSPYLRRNGQQLFLNSLATNSLLMSFQIFPQWEAYWVEVYWTRMICKKTPRREICHQNDPHT